jgi:hypothetical protein
VGQIYTAPSSGNVYKWDGAVWTTTYTAQSAYWADTGTALTPVDATKPVAIKDTTAHNALLLGSRTAKAHFITHPTGDAIYYAMNQGLNAAASAWVQDDVSRASWMLGMDSNTDQFNAFRAPAGGPQALLLTLDNAGNLTLPSNEDRLITMGAGTVKGYVGADASGGAKLSSNHPWAPTDNAKQGWMLDLSQTSDLASIFHKAPGTSTITTPLQIRGSDGKTVCTLADNSITKAMVSANNGIRQFTSGWISGSPSLPVNTWTQVGALTLNGILGGLVEIFVSLPLSYASGSGAAHFYVGVWRDGAPGVGGLLIGSTSRYMQTSAGVMYFPVPPIMCFDYTTAGNHTWYCYVYPGNSVAQWSQDATYRGVMSATEYL